MAEKKTQVRFSNNDDIKLLLEVAALNPINHKGKWNEVADRVNIAVNRENFFITARRARERTFLLLDTFKRKTTVAKNSSGIEEEHGEKEMLLQDIQDVVEEEERQRDQERKDKCAEERNAADVRKRALETLTPEKGPKTGKKDTPAESSKRVTVMTYLQEKAHKEFSIKERELELREKQLQLEADRFKLEQEERRKRMDQEREERAAFMAVINNLLKK